MGELRRVARTFDAVAALPYVLAAIFLGRLVTSAASGTPDPVDLFWMAALLMFLVGVGIGTRQGLGRELSYELGADGIEVRQPRLRWQVPWARVSSVEETPEFFLVATPRIAFYIPKRAVEGDGEVARLRAALAARGAP